MRTILGLLFLLSVCVACASPAATTRDATGDMHDRPSLDAPDTSDSTAPSDLAPHDALALDTLPTEVSTPADASLEAGSFDANDTGLVDAHTPDTDPDAQGPDTDASIDTVAAPDVADSTAPAEDALDAHTAADTPAPFDVYDIPVTPDVTDVTDTFDAPEVSACPEGRTPTAEVCNGMDDDCDGLTDEGVSGHTPCTRGLGRCLTTGNIFCNGRDPGFCNAVPRAATDEICNNADDDCDGRVDNLPPEPCPGFAIGACRPGTRTCERGVWSACVGAVAPTREVCNGIDDDCDNSVDNGSTTAPRCGVGACNNSGSVCPEAACTPRPATGELCDGQDNDCDGQRDENLPVGTPCFPWETRGAPGLGVCQGYGEWRCSGGSLGGGDWICATPYAMAPRMEQCNGRDDDCNGVVDDPYATSLGPCFVTVDGCRRRGVERCDASGNRTCAAEPFTRGPEVCNGQDDDCDGAIDEDGPSLASAPCTVGLGACARPGVYRCAEPGPGICVGTPGAATVETCNNVDDDCDGTVDDVLPTPCEVIHPWCRRHGVWRCAPGYGRVCTSRATTRLADPDVIEVAEECNGRDDDCNGLIDEMPRRGPDGGLVPCPTASP